MEVFFFFPSDILFLTNMESNADVTLQFEDIAVQNYLFLKYVCICLWKIYFFCEVLLINMKFVF